MNLVSVETATKAYGPRTLLDGVSLGVAARDRIGVVGRNGDGKTTLVSLLAGRETPDTGRVAHTRGLRVGLLAQHDDLDPSRTVRQTVLGDQAEHEWAADPRVREVLAGLFGGLDLPGLPHGLSTPVGALSGGERRRVALARLLTRDRDLLVLDEPTNHLDVEGIDWLARYLASDPAGRTASSSAIHSAAVVVVTHDRWLLDTVCTRTWEVGDGRVREYGGGYSAYVLARAERTRLAAAASARRQNLLRKELAWLRRGPPARTSKPKFRVEAAEALIADEPPARDRVELMRFATARLGKTVCELHDVRLRVGDGTAGRTLLDGETWRLGPGDRVGLIGVNGSGKTSVLRALTGELAPAAGQVVIGKTVRMARLSQELDELRPDWRVLPAVESVRRVIRIGKGRELTAGQLLERFGFVGERQWTSVRDLSGGERRRLQLLRLLMGEPNVLLLDEPTNDLDIDTLTALEDLLDGWPGSLVVVSHDRYFLERTTDHVIALLGDGRLSFLAGGVDEYLTRRRAAAERAPAAGRRRAGDTRAARKELTRLERQIERLADRERELHDEMARAATDHTRLGELDGELREVTAERERHEERWLEIAEHADDVAS